MMHRNSFLLAFIMLSATRTITSFMRNACSSHLKRVAINVRNSRSTTTFLSMADGKVHVSKEAMIALAERVREVNDLNGMESVKKADFIPFKFNGTTYGYTSRHFANLLGSFTDTFIFDDVAGAGLIQLAPAIHQLNLVDRSAAVAKVTAALREQKVITGWRDELLPVVASWCGEPVLLMERAAVPYFGMKAYGVHINGYVRNPNTNEILLWVAKRSKSKSTFPGMYDHIVAGGQPYGISPLDNVIKECEEEASMPYELSKNAKSVGAVSYTNIDKNKRLKRDTLFCYDIELPENFIPKPMDGEVESFELKNLTWVLNKIVEGGTNGYKPNCNIVIIDFLIRQGVITSECFNYLELVSSMRDSECS